MNYINCPHTIRIADGANSMPNLRLKEHHSDKNGDIMIGKRSFKRPLFLLLPFFFILFFIPIINAEQISLPPVRQNEAINLIQNCVNSTYANITRITYPNLTFSLNSPTIMTKNGDDYNYTYSNTNSMGTYYVYGNCDENGQKITWAYNFIVSLSGDTLDTSTAIIYFAAFLLLTFLFTLSFFVTIKMPFKNSANEISGMFEINKKKYLKIFFGWMTYMIALSLAFLAYNITSGYLRFNVAGNIFHFIYFGMLSLLMPVSIIFLLMMILGILHDKKMWKAIQRGLPFR